MVSENSIFRGLATKDCENTTTELLVNLLQYKCIRDIFFQCILSEDKSEQRKEKKELLNKIKTHNIKTQVVFSKSNQKKIVPDIVIENNECFIVIENKVKKTTKLQLSQIDDYPKLLESKEKIFKSLIFLLPDGYDEKEIDSINTKYKIKIKWSKFFLSVYESDLVKLAPIVNEALQYLKSIVEIDEQQKLNERAPIYKVALEYDLDTLKREKEKIENIEIKIKKCKEDVINQLKNSGITKIELFPSDDIPKNAYQFGSLICSKEWNNNKLYGIWIGCSPCYFSEDDNKRFSIQLALRNDVLMNENLPENGIYDFHDGWLYFDLENQDENKIVEKSIELIKKYHKSFMEK